MSPKQKNDKAPFVWVEVNLNLLKKNLRVIRARLKDPTVEILAVVKADAYGHGIKAVAETLSKERVRFFGVANIEEATALRKVCPDARILVLGSFHPGQIRDFIEQRIAPTVSSMQDLRALCRALRTERTALPIHVKMDTGMGRLGMPLAEAAPFFKRVMQADNIFVEGLYTHFSSADRKNTAFTKNQIASFDRLIRKVRSLGIRPLQIHAANSISLIRHQEAHWNLVRPGIILYGLNPSEHHPMPKGLEPILSWKTRISFLKEAKAGSPISYGATYRTPKKTLIAVLPVGYSYGYRVGFSNKASVIIRGMRCPVVGRVTMDQTLVDVGHLPRVRRWDEVTLIGKNGNERVRAEELATLIDSIPYEIVCSIHSRIPRVYKGIQ